MKRPISTHMLAEVAEAVRHLIDDLEHDASLGNVVTRIAPLLSDLRMIRDWLRPK